MRFLIYGDLHINHGKSAYTTFLKETVNYLIEQIREHKPDVLINLGDTLDTFGTQNVKDVVFARDVIRRLTVAAGGAPHYVLRGNHDTGDKHGDDTWTDVFEMDFVEIVNHPSVHSILGKNFLFVPYTRNFSMEQFTDLDKHCTGVFAHTDWIGCRLTPKHISTTGFVPADVAEALPGVPVFAGHYHTPMQAGPVYFVGSPLYMTHNDEVTETPRGFTLWDTDADTKVRIPNPHTYICRTFTCDTLPQLKKARQEIGDDASRSRVRVFTKRRLIDTVEEIFFDCLWLGVYPQDNEKTEVTFGTKVAIQATPMEIVDQASAIAPDDLSPELVKSTGRQAFHVEN